MKETYKGYTIQSQGEGFQVMPNSAGRIATFWVVNEDKKVRSMFVVARSLTDSFSHIDQSEDLIIDELIILIKSYIDGEKVKDLEEYTFEYKNGQLFYDSDPKWWNKTLRKYFSKSDPKSDI
ncbi:hypothetical protein A2773_05770 [Candidatus Gottesmanbacteria bacterium RIFCSPHIGHO2_01_FULL_39_10]|uniref:Uncharacterized protein n=1 Tax=Candidatus Gottesmanbacteria bacterium RIFCSPHIGHO2_01_FULL_39_10 TaxID=1798375 RepID=A0A1F5ZNL4_9BACT|nr:MAG: hypothetical protein A2773_05770 [Candidatus Gottesmanbacteria bacterium RIFCSPHIGHO2_01_FULL_39_10]